MKKFVIQYTISLAGLAELSKLPAEDQLKAQSNLVTWEKSLGYPMVQELTIVDLPSSDSSENPDPKERKILAYSMLKAESADAIKALLVDCPHLKLPDASVQILEKKED